MVRKYQSALCGLLQLSSLQGRSRPTGSCCRKFSARLHIRERRLHRFSNNAPQYVGQSVSVSKRFIAGVDKLEKGYVWPVAGGDFTVYFFEVPPQDHFRKAIEMEVMLLLRLHTGFWPIESSGAHPFHQLKSSSEINMASTRAREILEALFQQQPKFAASSKEGSDLLAAFDGAEAILGRR